MSAPTIPLSYNSVAEEVDFLREVALLDAALYMTNERPAHLLVIYRRLVAALSPIALQLREAVPSESRPPLLQTWLTEWVINPMEHERLFDTLLYLDARGLDAYSLQELFQLPDHLQTTASLGLLRAAPLAAIRQWVTLMAEGYNNLATHHQVIAYRLILETFFHDVSSWLSPY